MGEHRKTCPVRLSAAERVTVERVSEMLGNQSAALRFIVCCFANMAGQLGWDWGKLQAIRCSQSELCTPASLSDVPTEAGTVEQLGDMGRGNPPSEGMKLPPHSVRPKVNRRRMARTSLPEKAVRAGMGLSDTVWVRPLGTTFLHAGG